MKRTDDKIRVTKGNRLRAEWTMCCKGMERDGMKKKGDRKRRQIVIDTGQGV